MSVLLTIAPEISGLINAGYCRRTAMALLQARSKEDFELSIVLTSDSEIAGLNRDYRHKDKATNVLAFPQMTGDEQVYHKLLGDIVISVETAAREAALLGISLHRRLTVLLVHGFVHLLGFDHERGDREAVRMENEENNILEMIRKQQRRGSMTKLAINVDHVATLRQARGITEPDPVLAAGICELAGAEGIVVHLREDRRHIVDRDVRLLRETVKTKLNLEMGATEGIIQIACELKPDMITLVPEKREELTTEGGLDVARQKKKLADVIARMTALSIPVSLFIDPDKKQVNAARAIGATFVEIHTGRYCDAATDSKRDDEFDLIAETAEHAFESGLRVNAGHGLNYLTAGRIAGLDTIEELSIGHGIMVRAMFVGLDQAVREMLAVISQARK